MKKFQITAGILAILCLLTIGISTLVQNRFAGKLTSQQVCERWASDGSRYAQLSAFISPNAGYDAGQAGYSLPTAIDSALVNASISAANDSARLYISAYSAEADVSLSMRSQETGQIAKSGVGAAAMGVGADFFQFHQLKLLSGQYFDPTEEILNEQIIIDNNVAWQFFGSPDVVGKELLVNGRRCFISGVCEVDEDYARFYGEKGRIFMSYSLLSELNGELPITCVELCMPDPVKGFALDILKQNLGAQEKYVEYVENSARFTDSGLLSRLGSFSERSVRERLVTYPYWENTAVMLVDKAAILYIFKLIPMVLLALLILSELILAYVKRRAIFGFIGTHIRSAAGRLGAAWRRFRQNRKPRKNNTLPDKEITQ